MQTAIEILIKNRVIRNLSYNYEQFEYVSDDPKSILPSIEEYANQFKQTWSSVIDKLPQQDVDVITWNSEETVFKIESFDHVDKPSGIVIWNDFDSMPSTGATHWMTLPYPPSK